jgi:catechol 2,3-dioxygenase-like lactoylglutathione lyase family enzyme
VRGIWQNAGVIKGIHHLGFTVRDAEASAAWYVEVLGFRRVGEHQALDGAFRKVFLRHDNLPSRIGLTEHRAGSKDVFDETRIGLDHLSFGVTDRAELDAWVAAGSRPCRLLADRDGELHPWRRRRGLPRPRQHPARDLLRPGLGRTRLKPAVLHETSGEEAPTCANVKANNLAGIHWT